MVVDDPCQAYMETLYQHQHLRLKALPKRKQVCDTYGEILYPSVNHLLSYLSLTPDDIFYDLGSGSGKVAMQVFLKTNIKACYGIEYATVLHQQAVEARESLHQSFPFLFEKNRILEYILGDFFETSFTAATFLYLGSPCFSQPMLNRLGNLIDSIPTIHTVFTLRPINNLTRMTFMKAIRVECSWDSALCYLYQR